MASGTPVARLSVRVLPDTSEFGPKLRAQLQKVGNFKVNVDPDLTGFAAKIKAEAARVRDVKVGVDVDRSFRDRVGFAAQQGISRNASRISNSVADAVGAGVRKAFSFSTGVVKFSAIGLGAATAAAGVGALLLKVVPLVGEIGQLAGLLPLIPAALGGLAGIAGAVVLGLHGMGDAFKNMGDPKKFAEAIAKLTPSARGFAVAAKDIKDAFKGIQMDVQERLFKGLGDELRSWKDNLLPALASGFGDIATGLNGVANNVIAAFGNSKVTAAIKSLFGNTGSALTTAGPGFASILTGFTTMSAAASKFFDRFAVAFTNGGAKFEAWVDKIVANGQLDKWVNQGVDAFKNIAGIVGNLSSVIASVTRAATAASGGMLEGFAAVTGRFAEWAKSDVGQRLFANMFRTADEILSSLAPIIPALGKFSVALDIGGIAEKVGPQIANIIDALKPAASSLGQLLQDIATPLGKALTSFATYIGPAIDALAPGVKDLFGALQKIAPDLGSILVDVAGIGSKILTFIADALPGFVSAVKKITGIISDVVGSLGSFGGAIGAAVLALAAFGGGGKGGKGGLAKTAIGGGLLVDSATSNFDLGKNLSKSTDSLGKTLGDFGKNIGEAAAAGALIGSAFGPLGTAIGGLAGIIVSAGSTILGFAKDEMDQIVKDLKAPYADKKANAKNEFGRGQDMMAILKDINPDAYAKILAKQMMGGYNTKDGKGNLKWIDDIQKAMASGNKKIVDDANSSGKKVEGAWSSAVARTTEAIRDSSASAVDPWKQATSQVVADTAAMSVRTAKSWSDLGSFASTSASTASGAWSRAATDSATFTDNSSALMQGAWTRAAASATWSATTTEAVFTYASASSARSADSASALMQGAWTRAGSSAAGAASQADGAWRSAASNSGGAWQGFYNSFNTSRPAQASAASAQGALNAWSGVGARASGLGAEFGNGLAAGINSRRGAVESAANDLAGLAIRAAALAARVASPSRAMMEIGAYMSEGLAVGISSNVNMVRSAAHAASSAAIDTAAGRMAAAGPLSNSGPSELVVKDSNDQLIGRMRVESQGVTDQYDANTQLVASTRRPA